MLQRKKEAKVNKNDNYYCQIYLNRLNEKIYSNE